MKRKYVGILAAVIVGAGILVPSTAPVFANGAQETTAKGPITLTVWDFKYGDPRTGAVMKEMDNAFMAANPDVVIKHVAQPEDNYYQLLGTAAAAKKGPDIALFHVGAKHQDFDDYLVDLGKYSSTVKSKFTTASVAKSSDKSGKKWETLPHDHAGHGYLLQ